MAIIKAYMGNGKGTKSYKALALTKKDPKLAAMVSKVERGIQPTAHDGDGNRKNVMNNAYAFRSMLQKRAKRNSDATAIIKLLPDIELSAQILTSSILSPKDMMTMELLYQAPKDLLNAELTASMINRLKRHFDEDYKITPLLSEMVREPLFENGSYPIAVIPENAIDEIINGNKKISLEELGHHFDNDGSARNLGVLGPHELPAKSSKLGVVFEEHRLWSTALQTKEIRKNIQYLDSSGDIPDWKKYTAEEFLLVTDNPNVLKVPKINEKTKKAAIDSAFNRGGLKSGLTTALESMSGGPMNDARVERAIYRSRQVQAETIVNVKHQHELLRRSVGNPLILKLPTESVLPVHVPGDPKTHVGYFVLLDEEGNPVSAPDGDQLHPGLNADSQNSVGSNLIKKASMNMGTGGNFDPMNPMHINHAQQIYSDMVERDLISRVKNGVYSSSVAIAKNEEVYRLMLSRVLARKYTQLLYLPIEYMTYIAFKYGDDGIGRSMLDDQAMINTLRSVLLFSDVMASVKNSIGRTKVSATIPENDPNPLKTIETAMDEIVRSRTLGIPLGVSNPADIMEFIQKAGYEWEFTGHKGLPDLKFEFQQTQSSYSKPDTDLVDSLRKSSIMGFGLSPETVDNGFNTEFATTAVANNVLLSKRVVMWQDIFTPQLSDHMRKVARNTEDLMTDLRDILEANVDKINMELDEVDGTQGEKIEKNMRDKIIVSKALIDFVSGFSVTLPRPSSVTLENQVAEMETYSGALDKALDSYLTSDMFATTVTGELSNEANTVRALVKAYYMRKWMSEKNIMAELSEMVTADESGKPQLMITDEIKAHLEAMTKTGVTTLVSLQDNVKAINAQLKDGGVTVGDNGDAGSDNTSSEDTDFGADGSDGDSFGMDDLGNGEELTENTPSNEPEEEPTAEEPVVDAADEPVAEPDAKDDEPTQ